MRLSHLTPIKNPNQNEPVDISPEFLAIIDEWLSSLHHQNYSAHTIKAYQVGIYQFARFIASDAKLQGNYLACNKKHLELFFSQKIEQDLLKVSSIKQTLSAIRQFYVFAIQLGATCQNPTLGYRLKSQPRPLPEITTEALMARLLDQPPPDNPKQACLWVRDKAMFELMYSSGLRLSELVGLDVADVDMSNKNVCVLGKGGKMRLVPVGKKALEALQAYLPYRQAWQKDTQALFISERHGKRLSQRAVQLRLKACALSAGIDQNLYPHLLRHCFASHMLSASGDLRAIQEMLGHSSISTTQIYTQVDFATLSRTYDKAHPRAVLDCPTNIKNK